ncbi:MAG TPA: heavy metal-associated domain-containing protein [Patescibacteria group bacterium]|nr:heavy metal-associated domain-containing protein [Patescibacteria group bacterium]
MTTTLKITGMHCASCKTLIEDVCGDVKGVRSASVDPKTGLATIEHDDALDPAALVNEIRGLGDYGAAIV